MIHLKDDSELCALFKAECDERLQRLDEGIFVLEAEGAGGDVLAEMQRDAHTLKGSAGMVGAVELQRFVHAFEDLMAVVSKREGAVPEYQITNLRYGVDTMRRFVEEAVTGEPAGIDLKGALDRLAMGPGAELALRGTTRGEPPLEDDISDAILPSSPQSNRNLPDPFSEDHAPIEYAPSPDPGEPAIPRFRLNIDTIRVDPQRLDDLMTHAGELIVARTRMAQRLAEVERLAATLEDNLRDVAALRHVAHATAGERGGTGVDSRLSLYGTYHERLTLELESLRSNLAEDSTKLDFLSREIAEGIRAVRLVPLSAIFNFFPRMVRDLARELGKEVRLEIEGGETSADKRIVEELKDPLMHMIRNAIDHGIELPAERVRRGKRPAGTITISAYRTTTNTIIEISDDGAGLDSERIRSVHGAGSRQEAEAVERMSQEDVNALIFSSGFSTSSRITNLSGRGVGLDVVRSNIEGLKGAVTVESAPGRGCTFRITLPMTLATARMLIVASAGEHYAIPIDSVLGMMLVSPGDIHLVEGVETVRHDGGMIPVAPLTEILRREASSDLLPGAPIPCILLRHGRERYGLLVDGVIDEQEVVLKPESSLLRNVRNVAGSTILASGAVCIILDPEQMPVGVRTRKVRPNLQQTVPEAPAILMAEDSVTTRTQMKRILEGAGYRVTAAVDGADAFARLNTGKFDAVVSDVEMPNMDGLTLTARIREQTRFRDLPIVLVTSLSRDEDRMRGIEVGANAYITKPAFDQTLLLDTLRRLI